MALTKFAGQTNCSRRVKTNSVRGSLDIEGIDKLLSSTLESAEAQAAKTLNEDAYEDFMFDLINLLNDRKIRMNRIRQERLIHWDDE